MKKLSLTRAAIVCLMPLALVACASNSSHPHHTHPDQSLLPASIQVPAGHEVFWRTSTQAGEITYECKSDKDMKPNWVFAGPKAALTSNSKVVGSYYGPPATWESLDGSKITATQVAVAPAGAGNLPYQLVKVNPHMLKSGVLKDASYIQRVALKGGVAPSAPCEVANVGAKMQVPYSADYIFWKPSK